MEAMGQLWVLMHGYPTAEIVPAPCWSDKASLQARGRAGRKGRLWVATAQLSHRVTPCPVYSADTNTTITSVVCTPVNQTPFTQTKAQRHNLSARIHETTPFPVQFIAQTQTPQ
jgi:hypothetical protein